MERLADIDWGIVARMVHVLAVVVWIGGVWFVTVIVLPAMRKKPPQEWLAEFNAVERLFAPQARIAVLIVAAGKGVRAGTELPKQFEPLAGKPMLRRTVEAFCGYPVQVVIGPG